MYTDFSHKDLFFFHSTLSLISSKLLNKENIGNLSMEKICQSISFFKWFLVKHQKERNSLKRVVYSLKRVFCQNFQYGFRYSRSTADLLTVVSDRIAKAFNRSGATRAVALKICKTFDRVWHAGLLHKLKSYGISGQIWSYFFFSQ